MTNFWPPKDIFGETRETPTDIKIIVTRPIIHRGSDTRYQLSITPKMVIENDVSTLSHLREMVAHSSGTSEMHSQRHLQIAPPLGAGGGALGIVPCKGRIGALSRGGQDRRPTG